MSKALAFAMLLIYQRQARSLQQQQRMRELFSAFVAGELTAEQYEKGLTCCTTSSSQTATS